MYTLMIAMQYNGMNRRLLESDILYSEYAVCSLESEVLVCYLSLVSCQIFCSYNHGAL